MGRVRRPRGHDVRDLIAVTRGEGFLTRDELVARYEERTGRSMAALNWYQALALWKAAVFMEGNYKRSWPARRTTSTSGCSTRACRCSPRRRRRRSTGARRDGPARRLRRRAHDERVRLVPRVLRGRGARPAARSSGLFRGDAEALGAAAPARARRDRGGGVRASCFGERLGIADARRARRPPVRRHRPDEAMVEAVRRAAARASARGSISNSWGAGRYDRSTFPRAVRRRRDLRRRRHAQARSRRSTGSGRSARARRRTSACSWTTCARTARAPRRSG